MQLITSVMARLKTIELKYKNPICSWEDSESELQVHKIPQARKVVWKEKSKKLSLYMEGIFFLLFFFFSSILFFLGVKLNLKI